MTYEEGVDAAQAGAGVRDLRARLMTSIEESWKDGVWGRLGVAGGRSGEDGASDRQFALFLDYVLCTDMRHYWVAREDGAGPAVVPAGDASGRDNTDDATVAEHSADFLEGVVERHPSYRGRTFVVLGASYAGVYIPMLAKAILARGSGAKNASLLRHFVLDMIILPRQARDKRRESSQKQRCVSRSVPAAPHSHRRRQRGDRPLSRLELPRRRPGKKTRAFVRHF